jgi:hypothetical protein
MPRRLKIAAAQMTPGRESASREGVDRMLVLPHEAAREGVQLIACPDMALTIWMLPALRRWTVLGRRQPRHDGGLLQPVTSR